MFDLSAEKAKVSKDAELAVTDHKASLPFEAVAGTATVKYNEESFGEKTLIANTDYVEFYSDNGLTIELLKDGGAYNASSLTVSYMSADPTIIDKNKIITGFESIELCLTKIGVFPDLLCAPKYSHDSEVAAIMATKAANISGIMKAKALCDIDSGLTGATAYDKVYEIKKNNNMSDSEQIVCWPMGKLGDKKFHMSTQLAGLMASVDTENEGTPYESPSNKNLKIDSLCLADGTEVDLTILQANTLNNNGVVTALNFFNGWVAWGNYTACYPSNTDVKDYFIPVSRMFKWISNTLVKTFWTNVDDPMNRRLIDTVLDSANIWINGLVGRGFLLGGRFEMLESENPLTDLMAGIVRVHAYITPPSPAQQIDFVLEYDVNYVESALS